MAADHYLIPEREVAELVASLNGGRSLDALVAAGKLRRLRVMQHPGWSECVFLRAELQALLGKEP